MRILIADDHSVVRKGLVQIISEIDDISEIDEAKDGYEALSKVKENDYDLLVLDISMPNKNGLDVLKDLKNLKLKLPVLVLSTYPEELFAVRAFKSGASGYLNKNSAPEELSNAIKIVMSGAKYISKALAEKIASNMGDDANKLPHEKLSDRELNIFRLIAEGRTPTEIANELSLSKKTVSAHKSNILVKMNLKSAADITIYAMNNNLFT